MESNEQRPTKPASDWAPGQRRHGPLGEGNKKTYDYEVIDRRTEENAWGPSDKTWWVMVGDGYNARATICEDWPSTLLGGPTPGPTGERPKPAKGQRWRDTKNGKTYSVGDRWHHGNGWYAQGPEGLAVIGDDEFTNGRCEFVDHGPTPAAEQGGRSEPISLDGKHDERCNCLHCYGGRGGRRESAQPAPLTARAILQSRQRDRDRVRAEAAEAVAGFVDFFDLLPDATEETR